ncbi:MAG: DUF1801 domain-containing protein [Planctomycetota bacterium]|nr:DUF1801 domain-containing protein [Planctomycetota bacterium]
MLQYVCMPAKPQTVDAYLAGLPEERREVLQVVRKTILENLPQGYEEGVQYGMIGYYVPHTLYPSGYHTDPQQPLPFASLASQKNHMAIYLMSVYGDPDLERWFRDAWTKTGKRLDMGKSCVRFKNIEAVPLEVIAETVRRVSVASFIEQYEAARSSTSTVKRKVTKKRSRSAGESSQKRTVSKGGARKTVRRKKLKGSS